jgi:probable F420-dependent oxidoreductase
VGVAIPWAMADDRRSSVPGRFKVGAQLHPSHTTLDDLRAAWRRAEALGVDSLWVWDHFFPTVGSPDGPNFECWSLLAAMAADTSVPLVGTLVLSIGYRNADLLADMARTVDVLSAGRLVLGLGAGWFERDYEEYGFSFGSAASRLSELEEGIVRIRRRLSRLDPPPAGPLPILVGGGGERVTLRIVAEHADAWNAFGPLDAWRDKNAVLDQWCERVGRDPADVERTVTLIDAAEVDQLDVYLAAGVSHVIFGCPPPYDFEALRRLLAMAGR